MIASLYGVLRQKTPHSVVVDVQGVGYEVLISLPTYSNLPAEKESVHLRIYTHVREDAIQLFGFTTAEEKSVFLLLLGVSGIGPRLAINILSGLPLAELVAAVKKGDIAKLSSIPGIGAKTAGRLALELKEKIAAVAGPGLSPAGPGEDRESQAVTDAVSALVNLGYKPPLAKEAVKKVLGSENGAAPRIPVEELIKRSLKELSRS